MTAEAQAGGAGESVLCAKCDHSNPLDLEVCAHCGAHLYVFCRFCGKKNPRAARRCSCGADLHRPRRRRSAGKAARKRVRLTVLILGFVALALSMVYAVGWLVYWLRSWHFLG
jgi:hypothetical protein